MSDVWLQINTIFDINFGNSDTNFFKVLKIAVKNDHFPGKLSQQILAFNNFKLQRKMFGKEGKKTL